MADLGMRRKARRTRMTSFPEFALNESCFRAAQRRRLARRRCPQIEVVARCAGTGDGLVGLR